MLRNIRIVIVPVSDKEAAGGFYVGRLGLSVLPDSEAGAQGRWLQVAPEGSSTSLALVPGGDSSPPGSLGGLVLETSDIDADVAQLSNTR